MKASIDRFTRVEDLPEFLSADEVAAWTGLSSWSIYEAIKRNELACARWGRRVLIPRSALVKLAGRE
jgi:excisionase family DNA binding protein